MPSSLSFVISSNMTQLLASVKAPVSSRNYGIGQPDLFHSAAARHNQPEISILSSDPGDISGILSSPSPQAVHNDLLSSVSRPTPSSLQVNHPANQRTLLNDSDIQSLATELLQASTPRHFHTSSVSRPSSLLIPEATSSSLSLNVGYISNRRISSYVEEPLHQPRSLSSVSPTHDLRISMTPDGMAKIVNRAVTSPSPEKPHSTIVEAAIVSHLGSLRRSYSVAGLDTRGQSHKDESCNPRKFARTSTWGRSRDSRTWEFWCDSDARNSLIERAAQESSGSAAEAICLMRSNSSRVLRLNAGKRNSSMIGYTGSRGFKGSKEPKIPKQPKSHEKKQKKLPSPSLRGSFTQPCIGTSPALYDTHDTQRIQPRKRSATIQEQDDGFDHFHTESDKENWEPDEPLLELQGREPAVQSKKISSTNTTITDKPSSFGPIQTPARRSRLSKKRAQELAILVDAEAGGSRHDSSSSEGDDLDCVQSLLSLSQGNWS